MISFVRVAVVLLALLVETGCAGTDETPSTEDEPQATQRDELHVGELTLRRGTPAIVRTACVEAQKRVTVAVVCPDLTPESRYTRSVGLWGPMIFSPDTYALTFNNGDVGKGYVHWIVGIGIVAEIQQHVLSDRNNVVKGLPRLTGMHEREGREIELWEFPPHPAGGPNGGHGAATVSCRARLVFASIHGAAHVAAAEEMALDLARLARCPH
ncbi:MAG: hypothetical protein ACRDNB_01425 [Gaiellaceae bacterium]